MKVKLEGRKTYVNPFQYPLVQLAVQGAFYHALPGQAIWRKASNASASFRDVLPTLLEAIGLGNDLDALSGKSLMPRIRGEDGVIREAIISSYYEAPDRCIRDKVWGYVRCPKGEPNELYNLMDDPKETINLIDRYPREAQRLAGAFGSLYALKGAPVKGIQGKYEVAYTGVA